MKTSLWWTLIWMFKALKVSCNLKGKRLGIAYICSILLSDYLSGYLIRLLYELNK